MRRGRRTRSQLRTHTQEEIVLLGNCSLYCVYSDCGDENQGVSRSVQLRFRPYVGPRARLPAGTKFPAPYASTPQLLGIQVPTAFR